MSLKIARKLLRVMVWSRLDVRVNSQKITRCCCNTRDNLFGETKDLHMKASATEIQVDLLIVCTRFCTTFPFTFKAARERKRSQSRDGLFLQHLTATIR